MRELVTADIPLQVEMRNRKDAINLFRGFSDCKEKWNMVIVLIKYYLIYKLNDTEDYFYGALVSSTAVFY